MKQLLVAAGLCMLFGSVYAAEPPPGLIKLDGRPAPALKLSDLDGKTVDITHSRGHWVLVHFWATWCGPCRKEMPTLAQLMQVMPAERLQVLLVNTAENEDDVFTFLASVSPALNSYLDRDGQVTERWQPRGLPASFLVDPQGRLRFLALGGRQWASEPNLGFLRELTVK